MTTLFNQIRKYYNQNNKILHLVLHTALQTTSLIGTTEPSSSVPGSSDKHALLLTEDNFEIILNLDKMLVHVMRYCVIKAVCISTANCRSNFFLNFFSNVKTSIFTSRARNQQNIRT